MVAAVRWDRETHKRCITARDYISKMMKEETKMGFMTPQPPGKDGGESSVYRSKSKFTHMKFVGLRTHKPAAKYAVISSFQSGSG